MSSHGQIESLRQGMQVVSEIWHNSCIVGRVIGNFAALPLSKGAALPQRKGVYS